MSVVISEDAYKHLCGVLVQFVIRADAGQMARDNYDAFVREVNKSNPTIAGVTEKDDD